MKRFATVLSAMTLAWGSVSGFASGPAHNITPSNVPAAANIRQISLSSYNVHDTNLVPFHAKNTLSANTNNTLLAERKGANFKNGTLDTIPYFNNWFITGTRNSVYTYSMVGHSPKAGGTTSFNVLALPIKYLLIDNSGNVIYDLDPTDNGN
ncbi:MAG: hypothetical protein JOZ43_07280, partial [Acidobacteriales bacterium]|nr:hypothetical protein [Terriglobales bacterium]